MAAAFKIKNSRLILAACLIFMSGCSLGSAFTSEGALGGAIGAAGGTGVGYLIGEQIGKSTENMLLGGAVGGGLGMLAGGMLHERNVKEVRTRQVLVREMRLVDQNQRQIDALREKLRDADTWGRSEVRPWNERYWGESYDTPYEGVIRP